MLGFNLRVRISTVSRTVFNTGKLFYRMRCGITKSSNFKIA